eukprot:g18255.t1
MKAFLRAESVNLTPRALSAHQLVLTRGLAVKELNSMADIIKESKAVKGLMVVDYTAKWCGPCKKVAPIFSKLSDEYPKAVFVKADVDVVQPPGISAVPTFHFLKNGQLVHEIKGADIQGLEDSLAKFS